MRNALLLGVFVFLCAQMTSQRPFRVIFDEGDKECIEELGLDESYVSKAFLHHFKLTEGDPQINDFVACSWNRTSFLDEQGNLNRDEVKEYFVNFLKARKLQAAFNMDSENVDDALDDSMDVCVNTDAKDIGDFAVKIYNCLIDALLSREVF